MYLWLGQLYTAFHISTKGASIPCIFLFVAVIFLRLNGINWRRPSEIYLQRNFWIHYRKDKLVRKELEKSNKVLEFVSFTVIKYVVLQKPT